MSRNQREGRHIGRVKRRQWINGAWTPWEYKRRQGHGVFKSYMPLSAHKKAHREFIRLYCAPKETP